MSETTEDSHMKEMLRLIESDHKSTTEYIARVTTLRTATRGIIIPLASALAGLSLANKSWIIAAMAVPAVAIGAISEARTDFLLRIAHIRLMRLEYKIQAYFTYLNETGTVADDARQQLDNEIDSYQFGISRSLRGESLRKTLLNATKKFTFWLYITVIAALTAIAIVVGTTSGNAPESSQVCVFTKSGVPIKLTELPHLQTRPIEIFPCPTTAAAVHTGP